MQDSFEMVIMEIRRIVSSHLPKIPKSKRLNNSKWRPKNRHCRGQTWYFAPLRGFEKRDLRPCAYGVPEFALKWLRQMLCGNTSSLGPFRGLFSNHSGLSLKQKFIGPSSHLTIDPVFVKAGYDF